MVGSLCNTQSTSHCCIHISMDLTAINQSSWPHMANNICFLTTPLAQFQNNSKHSMTCSCLECQVLQLYRGHSLKLCMCLLHLEFSNLRSLFRNLWYHRSYLYLQLTNLLYFQMSLVKHLKCLIGWQLKVIRELVFSYL